MGLRDFFGSEFLAKRDFFLVCERRWGFCGSGRKQRDFLCREENIGIFWVAKKALRDCFGYAKK